MADYSKYHFHERVLMYPNPILTTKICTSLTNEEAVFYSQELIQVVNELAVRAQPLGLAGPQIGYSKRIFIAQSIVYVNPWIKWYSKKQTKYKELCYSVPESHYIKRSDSIILVWQDIQGNNFEKKFYGLDAQVLQHEYDHIENRLINGHGRVS